MFGFFSPSTIDQNNHLLYLFTLKTERDRTATARVCMRAAQEVRRVVLRCECVFLSSAIVSPGGPLVAASNTMANRDSTKHTKNKNEIITLLML